MVTHPNSKQQLSVQAIETQQLQQDGRTEHSTRTEPDTQGTVTLQQYDNY